MRIRVYGANELVGGLEVFDAVSQGVAEIGHTGAYYWQGKDSQHSLLLHNPLRPDRHRNERVA